jgi:hypothetical protein
MDRVRGEKEKKKMRKKKSCAEEEICRALRLVTKRKKGMRKRDEEG